MGKEYVSWYRVEVRPAAIREVRARRLPGRLDHKLQTEDGRIAHIQTGAPERYFQTRKEAVTYLLLWLKQEVATKKRSLILAEKNLKLGKRVAKEKE